MYFFLFRVITAKMSFDMEKLFEDWSDEEELTRGVNVSFVNL